MRESRKEDLERKIILWEKLLDEQTLHVGLNMRKMIDLKTFKCVIGRDFFVVACVLAWSWKNWAFAPMQELCTFWGLLRPCTFWALVHSINLPGNRLLIPEFEYSARKFVFFFTVTSLFFFYKFNKAGEALWN